MSRDSARTRVISCIEGHLGGSDASALSPGREEPVGHLNGRAGRPTPRFLPLGRTEPCGASAVDPAPGSGPQFQVSLQLRGTRSRITRRKLGSGTTQLTRTPAERGVTWEMPLAAQNEKSRDCAEARTSLLISF